MGKYRKVRCPKCGFEMNTDSIFDYNCPECYEILKDVKGQEQGKNGKQ